MQKIINQKKAESSKLKPPDSQTYFLCLTIYFFISKRFLKIFKKVLKIITNLNNIILLVLQYSSFSNFGILLVPSSLPPEGREEGNPKTPKTPSGKRHPHILFRYQLLFDSDISALLQGSLAQYLFLNISAADTEPMNNNNNKIIIIASFLEFAISAGLQIVEC